MSLSSPANTRGSHYVGDRAQTGPPWSIEAGVLSSYSHPPAFPKLSVSRLIHLEKQTAGLVTVTFLCLTCSDVEKPQASGRPRKSKFVQPPMKMAYEMRMLSNAPLLPSNIS